MMYTQFSVPCDNIFFSPFFANSMKFQNEIFVYFFISKFLPQVYVIWSHGVYWFLMELLNNQVSNNYWLCAAGCDWCDEEVNSGQGWGRRRGGGGRDRHRCGQRENVGGGQDR